MLLTFFSRKEETFIFKAFVVVVTFEKQLILYILRVLAFQKMEQIVQRVPVLPSAHWFPHTVGHEHCASIGVLCLLDSMTQCWCLVGNGSP